MASDRVGAQDPAAADLTAADLTVGDLARRTGLTPAVLRTWEARYGFPRPVRLTSGHRRYAESDVTAVRRVLRRRDAGVRLEVAVAEAAGSARPPVHSVYAELRRQHPALQAHRLSKATLLALTWAIEDECCARAQRATLFGAFQEERYYRRSHQRWNELARTAHATMALAEFADAQGPDERATRVPLPADSPMRREWAVVCDAPDLPAVLAAWELPGQHGVPDRRRVFESVWTVDPRPVRLAARVCAHVALAAGAPGAGDLVDDLAADPPPATRDPAEVSSLFGRMLAYVDGLTG